MLVSVLLRNVLHKKHLIANASLFQLHYECNYYKHTPVYMKICPFIGRFNRMVTLNQISVAPDVITEKQLISCV